MPASTTGTPVRPDRQASSSRRLRRHRAAAGPVVLPRQVRSHGQDLVVEVAPAELPQEGLGPAALPRPGEELAGGKAAEMEIGAEPGAGGWIERLVALVLGDAVASQPVVQVRAAGGLASGRQLRRRLLAREPVERRNPAGANALRHPQLAWRRQRIGACPGAPGAPVGSEDAVMVAACGYELTRWNDRDPRERAHRDAGLLAGPLEPLLPPVRVPAHVLRDVERVGARVAGDLEGLLHRVPPPDDQPRAALPQGMVEIVKRVEQEGDPVRRPAPSGEEGVVDHEERHHLAAPGGRGEARVVPNPQIAREEDHGRHAW